MKCLVLTGPESSGKTVLSQYLALRYQMPYLPEYARRYLEKKGNAQYSCEEVLLIAQRQWRIERYFAYANRTKKMLICDTDLLVLEVWLEEVYGFCPEWIAQTWRNDPQRFYALCTPEVAWGYDPIREAPKQEKRNYLYEIYLDKLKKSNQKFCILTGGLDEKKAILEKEWEKIGKE